jgi:outer membrane protein OmpA-like peptidoglycan-associated protein
MSRAPHLAVLLATLLSGCATGPSLTLLTSEEGKQGAVALLDESGTGRETVVSELNSRTNLSGKPRTSSIDPDRLSQRQRDLLGALPEAPVFRTLLFFEGTTRITPESRPALEFLKDEVRRRPGADVQVIGYTDTVGSRDDNDDLSQRRAEEILKVLIEEGIQVNMLSAIGRGERELLVKTEDNVDEPRNRRVEVRVR